MTKTVFVLGELNIDAILSGKNVRPEPNKEKFFDDFEITLGSSSAITACRLAQLGADVHFVSVVGSDQFGQYCIERLQYFGVNTDFVVSDPDEKTGVTVSLSNTEDRSLLTFKGTIPKLNMSMIPNELFDQADHIHFGSFFLQDGMRDHWRSLFEKAKSLGISTSFDTGWDPNEQWHRNIINDLLPFTDFFIPSESEILHIYGCSKWSELDGRIPLNRGHIVVKRGKDGSSMLKQDNTWLHVYGFQVNPVDTTGAGDSFNAGIVYGYLQGKKDEALLTFANAAGALSTQYIGGTGGNIDLSVVLQFMDERGKPST